MIVEALWNKTSVVGQDLDKQIHSYLAALRQSGTVVNTSIVIACATGVVKSDNSHLLQCNGGLFKQWPKYLMERMGYEQV